MHCPFCQSPDSRVVDTRIADDGASIRRRRECLACKHRFTTLETSSFQVVKRSGVVEPFSRNKVVQGVMKACQGRPVDEHDLARLAQQVEEKLRSSGVMTVSSDEVGKAILPFLAQLDEIAYLRFASVYLSFNDLDDFEEAIATLRRKAASLTESSPHDAVGVPIGPDSPAGHESSASEKTRTPSAAKEKTPAKKRTSVASHADTTPGDKDAAEPDQRKDHGKPATRRTKQGSDSKPSSQQRKRRPSRKKSGDDSMPSLLDS